VWSAGLGVEQVEHDSGEPPFEGLQGLHGRVAVVSSTLEVELRRPFEAGLGECDSVQRGVELTVTAAGQAVPVGLAR
jgi:hypothetical protein